MYYGTNYTYDQLVEDLFSAKEVGDEFTLMLASKWLRKNITVITSKKDWSSYSNCAADIVVTYKGKDRHMRGKWGSSQVVSRSKTSKKAARKYIFIHLMIFFPGVFHRLLIFSNLFLIFQQRYVLFILIPIIWHSSHFIW